MSERNLTRVFKKLTGLTLMDYIKVLRIEKAKSMLFNPDLSIESSHESLLKDSLNQRFQFEGGAIHPEASM